MSFHITRQRYFSDNSLYIEISCGGKKNAGKDILKARYEGEGKTFVDPRDAVNIAERIFKRWENDYADEKKRLIVVGLQSVLIFELTAKGITSAKTWANKVFTGLQKCGNCNKAMGNRTKYEISDIKNNVFCTEVCLANKYRDIFGVEAPRIIPNKKKFIKKK